MSDHAELHIWPGWAAYVGPGRNAGEHRHLASELVLGVSGAVELVEHNAVQSCLGSFVPSQVRHSVNTANIRIVVLWSESLLVRQASKSFTGLQCVDCKLAEGLAEKVAARLPTLTPGEIDRMILAALEQPRPSEVLLESRVQHTLATIAAWPFDPNCSVTVQLAGEVQLSTSRLRHLFQEQVGVSLKNYLLWKRLILTLQTSAHGASLTEAAHQFGFADSAHFSRTFRSSFGLTPSEIMRSQFIQVIPRDVL
jgi:AraC family transcriptional regulator